MNKEENPSNVMSNLERKINFLENPERLKVLSPEEMLSMLPIKKSNTILDLGAGTGYLSIPAARMIDNLVYALDSDSQMLEFIDSKSKDKNITNIQLVEGRTDNIPLTDDSIDIVIASLILHEVNPLSKTLQEIKRVLKVGGYFLCFEYEKNENSMSGPPMHIRIPVSTMEQELIAAGFSVIQKSYPTDYLYIIIAKK